MRFAKFSRTLLLLALPAVPVACALAQDNPNIKPSTVRDQLTPQTQGAAQTPSAAPANRMPPGKAPVKSPTKSAAKAATKAATQKPAAKAPVEKPADQKASSARRDPFSTLLNNNQPTGGPVVNLPPGKAGLVVGTLHIDGIVRGSGGMIAIVSNPQQRVYFLREGDKLYDGSIEHITLEAITFHEIGKDAFGKPLDREVTKRLSPSPGEQQ
jgi:hypothetical protein